MTRLQRPKSQPALCRPVPLGWAGLLIAALAAGQWLAVRLAAADISWSGSTSTDWNDPTNWIGGILPGQGDNAHLDVSGGTTDIDPFTDPGFNATIQQLYVGDAHPNATLTQSSGTLNLNGGQAWLKIGAQSGSSGIYNLQGTGVLSLTNDVFGVGEHGVGTLNLSNSAQATTPRFALGRYAEGRGSVFQSGGTSLTVNGSGNDGNGTPNYALAVGEQSTALSSYTITSGTLTVTGGDTFVGMTSGSNGRMTVAGTGAVAAGREVHVGDAGNGTLLVNGGQLTAAGQIIVGNSNGGSGNVTQNGGGVSLTGGANLVLGNQGGGVGTYALAGGTLAASGRIVVGEDGLATFTQTGGVNNVTQDVSVGDHIGFSTAASPDTYSISGGTLAASSIQVGRQGYAVMNQSGGSVTTTTDVHFGGGVQSGRGIYNLSGGTLVTPSIFVSSAGNLAHQFNFTGGTLRVGSYNTTGTTTILGTLSQTSAAAPSLLDVTTQSTTVGASYSLSGASATAFIDNGKSLHVLGILSIDNQAAVSMTANPANQLLIDGSAANPNNGLNVGVSGAGQLTIAGGTFTVTTGDVFIGKNSGSAGVVSQSGGTTSLHAASPNWLFLGQSAGSQASYNLGGGTIAEPNNEEIGYGGTGSFMQSGGTNTAGTLSLARQTTGNGTYVLGGGTLIAGSVIGGAGTSNFKFNGGTLQPSGANSAFFQGMTGAIVQTGGALINTNGNNVSIAQNLLHDAALGATLDGGLVKNGGGTLTLSGASTFTGGATLAAGTIQLASAATVNSGAIASGPLGIGTLTLAGGTLQDDGSARMIPNNVAITGNVAFSSAAAGSLVLDSTGLSAPSTVTLSNSPTLTVGNNTTINDVVSGAGQALTKSGSGTLALGGANSYSGPTTVTAGTLRINGSLAAASAVSVNGGTLAGNGVINGSAAVATGAHLAPGGVNSIGNLTTGSLTLASGSVFDAILGTPGSGTPSVGGKSSLNAVLGTFTLPTNGTITVNLFDNAGAGGNGSFANGTYKLFTYGTLTGGNATFNNTFSIGAAPLGKVYTFSNSGPTSGEIDLTVVAAPTAKIWNGNINGTWDTSTANWQGGNTFSNNDLPTFDDAAAGTTAVTVAGGTNSAAMTFNNATKNYTVGGSSIGGAGSLTKSGAGMLTLFATNAYSGGTTVNGGILRVVNSSGSATGTNTLTVNSGGTLAGSGMIAGATTINAGATLAPSFGSGSNSTLTINNDLALANNSTLGFRLNSPGQANGVGGNDFVSSTGTLTLGTGVGLNITPGASFATGAYHLLGYNTLSSPGNFAGWNVGLQGTPATLGVRNYGFTSNAANKSIDLNVAAPASNLLLKYSFHDLNSAANPTIADTSGNRFTGTTLRNTNPADVATATGPDGLPAIHLTKDDNLGNINGGTATTGSGITTSTQANPALLNPSPGPTTQTFNITSGPFTATAWVKIDSLPSNNPNPAVFQVVFGSPPASSSDATGSLHMGFRNNAPYMGFWGNDLGGAALSNAFQSTWFHIAFRYNPASGGNPNLVASRQSMFINGGDGVTPGDATLYASRDGAAAYGQIRTLLIGRTIGSGTFVGAFGGSLADVRVYGAALDNAQIALVAAPAGTLFDWNSAAATDWTASANWFSTYAQPGPPGTGIADVAQFGTKQTIAAGTTINLNGAQQLAQLINTNANSWSLASGTAAGTDASPLVLRQISQRGAGTLTITSGLMIDDSNMLTLDSTTAGSVVIAGPIYNAAGGLTKTSTGTLTLSGDNTYGGPTTINSGTLRLGAPTFLSSGAIFSSPVGTGTLTLAGGTTLQDDGVPRTLANSVAITGNVTFSSAGSGSVTIDPSGLTTPATVVTLSNNPTLTVTNTTVIKSVIAGVGQSLTLSGGGSLTLGAANTYNGGTIVNSGTLTTTLTGTVGPGPLAVNSSGGAPSVANLGSSQTISALSSAVAGNGSATLNIGSGTTLAVNQAGNTTFAGMIVNNGMLAKSGGGTLEVNGAPTLAANSVLQVIGGKLRMNVISGSPLVDNGVSANVLIGATLELAGSISALAAGPNRANVLNNSQAAAGGLLVSGTNQRIGNLDGTGNAVVANGAALAANHIVQNALTIGGSMNGPATVTIAPSDMTGNPLAAENLPLFGGSSETTLLPTALAPIPPLVSGTNLLPEVIEFPATMNSTPAGVPAVPEPATFMLSACAAILLTCHARRRYARASRGPGATCNPC